MTLKKVKGSDDYLIQGTDAHLSEETEKQRRKFGKVVPLTEI
jgi:hypothetical protein